MAVNNAKKQYLVEKAKKMGYKSHNDTTLDKDNILFFFYGDVTYSLDENMIGVRAIIAKHRTPAQMYQIMQALED